MTGVADIYLIILRPQSKESRLRLSAIFQNKKNDIQRFVVLSWKRSGSNLLCGLLAHHPEIVMHNELFNPIDIFTYHPDSLMRYDCGENTRWTCLARDLWPKLFLDQMWSGKFPDGSKIKAKGKAVGFKSFPDHWKDANNEDVHHDLILDDKRVKKIILSRECELSVWLSMKRAEITGSYMTNKYPANLIIEIDIPAFQTFVNNYHFTFQRKYKSAFHREDSFRITYEQLCNEEDFDKSIAPLLWNFLGVSDTKSVKRLKEVTKQSSPNESFQDVISNFKELEFAFRHTNVTYFKKRRGQLSVSQNESQKSINNPPALPEIDVCSSEEGSWSILLPICSRSSTEAQSKDFETDKVGNNRFDKIERLAKYQVDNQDVESVCWARLHTFAASLHSTTTSFDRRFIEIIIGIDEDDKVFNTESSKAKIEKSMPCKVIFRLIRPKLYGKVCKIWNLLARDAKNDFIVLLGDDVVLLEKGWKQKIEFCFGDIEKRTGLPFGVACVAFSDTSFKGFPTFPVIHRVHFRTFDQVLPRQFVNQGGDPYLYELYSRYNASSFAPYARLKNTLGGDGSARYLKHDINWKGIVLNTQLQKLKNQIQKKPDTVCLDIVVPSFRTENDDILMIITKLRASVRVYVKFWIVVDNPEKENFEHVKNIADNWNEKLHDNNYFVNVIHYGENRGASYARNTGYNYSTADWVLFLDDDVIPDPSIIDAYVGSIQRYPNAKVMVGLSELPPAFNLWTEILRTSNVMYFYGIANHRIHPPWGVTANLMVKGSRHNQPVQFKGLYPKTGGGEDIDFVFQMKDFYKKEEGVVVSVKGAKVQHPWWSRGNCCYKQIKGWANGDSLCLTEWPEKTFIVAPNWIESILFLGLFHVLFAERPLDLGPFVKSFVTIATTDHVIKAIGFFNSASRTKPFSHCAYKVLLSFGGSTIISAQEITRFICALKRLSPGSLCRRMDWFDGQAETEVLDIQLRSILSAILYCIVVYCNY